jgi:hypothetical protein
MAHRPTQGQNFSYSQQETKLLIGKTLIFVVKVWLKPINDLWNGHKTMLVETKDCIMD